MRNQMGRSPHGQRSEKVLQSQLQSAYILSANVIVLAGVASLGGLLLDNLYQDNPFVVLGWYGNDLVTLFVAVPMLATALFLTMRGSTRAQLVWLGVLAYMLYNYAFYLFGAALNSFFLIYAALFTLTIFALIFGLVSLDIAEIRQKLAPNTYIRLIGGYVLVVSMFLGGFWVALSLNYVFTKEIPQIVVAVDSHTNLIAALDLSMVVSFGLLGATWLLQHQPWGYVIVTIWSIKGAVYNLVLFASTVLSIQQSTSADLLPLVLWGVIGIGCSIASVHLLASVNQPDRRQLSKS